MSVERTIRDDLARDLAPFADPATEVTFEDTGSGTYTARWLRNNVPAVATFKERAGRISQVLCKDRAYAYPAFLASEHLADLTQLAEMMSRLNISPDFKPQLYVDTGGQLEVDQTAAPSSVSNDHASAIQLIRQRAFEHLPEFATRVVFVHGDAGAGKSWALCKVAYDAAIAYMNGDQRNLFLYANAQGASLATFDQVLAQALDDYRARFTYHGVAVLARHMLLTVILDGFDEMLGSGGYRQAYSSLSDFIARLEGHGSLIASSRSTFYSYHDFHKSAARYARSGDLNYSLDPIRVEQWGRAEWVAYFATVTRDIGGGNLDGAKLYDRWFERESDTSTAGKPFFVAKLAEVLANGLSPDPSKRLLPQLIEAFVDREVTKITRRANEPLLTREQHYELLAEIAGEIWWQESGSVTIDTLQLLADLQSDKWHLPEAETQILSAKLPSYGLLASSSVSDQRRVFEHEVYLGYFLAGYVEPILLGRDSESIARFLRRGPLLEATVDEIGHRIGRNGTSISTCIANLSISWTSRDSIARENAGMIAAAVLDRRSSLPRLVLDGIYVRAKSIRDAQLKESVFRSCTFQDVDIRGTRFENVVLENTVFVRPIVDPKTTRFDGTPVRIGVDVVGIVLAGHDEPTYRHADVARHLEVMGATVADGGPTEIDDQPSAEFEHRADLVRRFVRLARRQFYVSLGEERLKRVYGDPYWPAVLKMMRECDIVSLRKVSKRGTNAELMTLAVDADEILRAEDPRVSDVSAAARALWRRLHEVE